MDRSAAERLVKKDLDETTGIGKPISSRARMSQRTVEAYLKAGVRPRWMERIAEIDDSIAAQKRRLGALPPRAARGVRRATARCSPSAGRAFAHRCRFEELNELIRSTTSGTRSSATCRWTCARATTC